MKRKLLSIIFSLALVLSMIAVVIPTTVYADTPNLKMGVVSDIHCGDNIKFKKVLKDFKQQNVDVVLIAGDITDGGTTEEYKRANDAWNEVFPDKDTAPKKAFIMGNHDQGNNVQAFMTGMELNGLDYYNDTGDFHLVVNGYHIIGASSGWTVDSTKRAWIRQEVEKAEKDTPGQPIFVTCHPHAQNTVYGSNPPWCDSDIYDTLKPYENVIYLSGHSHFVMEDERIIYQKDFTCLGTSTLRYTELEPGKENGTVPPDADKVCEGYIFNMYDDHVNVNRRNYINDTEEPIKDDKDGITNDFTIPVPIKKEDFTYTDARAESRQAPTWPAGSKVEVTEFGRRYISVKFNAAQHNDFVHSYQIDAYNTKTGNVDKSLKYFSDFYLGINHMKKNLYTTDLLGLDQGTDYQIRVYAIESFGKMSEPLTVNQTTGTNPNADHPMDADILNLDMTGSEIKDASANNSAITTNGVVKVEKDADLDKNVMKLNKTGSLTVALSDAQKEALGVEFTIETVIKPNNNKDTMGIVSNNIGGKGLAMMIRTGGRTDMIYNTSEEKSAYIGARKTLLDGYHHIAATFDGVNMSLYYDGKLATTRQVRQALTANKTSNIVVGGDITSSGKGTSLFDGNIALVKIYSNSLNATQIGELYSNFTGNGEQTTPADETSKVADETSKQVDEASNIDNDSSKLNDDNSDQTSNTEIATTSETPAKIDGEKNIEPSKIISKNCKNDKTKSPVTGYTGMTGVALAMAIASATGLIIVRRKNKK